MNHSSTGRPTMRWYSAPAVKSALREATERWPQRSRIHDGTVGDVAHLARVSDHNPDARGCVLAFDLTHDPANGCDAHELVRLAVERKDRRIKYAISKGRIWSKDRAAEGWRDYLGSNPHDKHAHVSVERRHEDDTAPWWPVPEPPEEDDDMPLTDADVERIAKRTLQMVANGQNRYGTDNLYQLLSMVLKKVVELEAIVKTEKQP